MSEKEKGSQDVKGDPKRRGPFYNTLSLIGFGIAGLALAIIVFFYLLDLFGGQDNPYLGLITFVALPILLIFGLILAFVGGYRANRRIKRGGPVGALPQIDFNQKSHRRIFGFFALGGVAFMAISAFGSYQVYEYTETVEFCGEVCHSVMKPEFVAYQHSPHAQVKCTACHVGEGAQNYLQSKMNGARQLVSLMKGDYSRPIPTPIQAGDPRKNCGNCHWPSLFHAQKLKDRTYFAADESNTRYEMSMLMPIGGVNHGVSEGIHAHMYLDSEIRYIATDPQRQEIPYVEMVDKDGKVHIYRSEEQPITDEQIRGGVRRKVDCIDCHNRPAHKFPHPANSVNQALAKGWLDSSLPEIKRIAVEALEGEYKTEAEALQKIEETVRAAYKADYAEVAAQKGKQIDEAIVHIRQIYRKSYFPEMKASWKAYPDNLDHMYSKGCFRCHDGKHKSDTGRVISMDCNSCHSFLSRKPAGGQEMVSRKGLPFEHPTDIGDAWQTTLCRDCHAPPPEPPE
jgi:nitrate/TMAO reductase-like tetraheme cytochrome c subunit